MNLGFNSVSEVGLNAPYGARCFLTYGTSMNNQPILRLNAPYGARCFLTSSTLIAPRGFAPSLNAPYGARCFLTCGTLPR